MSKTIVENNTQTPWTTSPDAVPEWHTQITVYPERGGPRIATVFNEADARLIAAAPEMLKALKGFIEYYEAYNPITDKRIKPYYKEIRAAIDKAERG